MLTLAAVIDHLEKLAPPGLAADWDNVGLLLGDRAASVTRIMTCLTVTPESAGEAIERKADLIVTHHPILFRAVKRLTGDSVEGRMLLALIQSGVAVYSPHTAFDNAAAGINDLLARKLGLVEVGPLRAFPSPQPPKNPSPSPLPEAREGSPASPPLRFGGESGGGGRVRNPPNQTGGVRPRQRPGARLRRPVRRRRGTDR